MKLPIWAKVVIGVTTMLPFIILVIAFTYIFWGIIGIVFSKDTINPFIFFSYIEYVIPVITGFILFYITLGLFYLVHMILNKQIDTEKKLLWIIMLFILNGLCLPFYWYLHIWKESVNPEVTHSYQDHAD